jgi:hypothetical protein
MGRESRRQRDPDDLNRGDAGRIVMAHGALALILRMDPRVQQHYDTWIAEHDRLVREGPQAGVSSEADVDQMLLWQRDAEIDRLAEILRPMGVPWRWAAEALIKVFPIVTHNARHPDNPYILQVSAEGLSTLPPGRKPRHQGKDILQWVQWWYRTKVKHPADSVYTLAQEYAAREQRHTRADSVVDDGIKRAESLLSSVIAPTAAR